jgi:DNA-binding SARP family transcriptional activator
MDVRILGPLEVWAAGAPAALGGKKQRALLAVLALNAGRTLSVSRLVDDLWGESPPDTAIKMIQIHVSGLRKVLPAGVLATRPPGYRLDLRPEQVDLGRAERQVREACAALAAGDAGPAAAALRGALDLWRGPALDEFSEPFAASEARRIEDLRLRALEARIEADLRVGGHAELVGELEALVGRHPLREGLRGQLMLALYRSGRQADALAAYQDARRALSDELGIEPSAALRALELRILRQDAELDGPPAEAPAAPPSDVGPGPGPLLERADALARLRAALAAAAAGHGGAVLISGEAGIGKTTLVRAFAGSARGRARVLMGACDDLHTPRSLGPFHDIAADGAAGLASALREGREAILAAALEELSTPTTVMVVEDAHWADDASLDVLRFLARRVSGRPGLLVLTYRDDEVDGGHPLRRVLAGFTGAEAVRLALPRLSREAVQALAEGRVDADALYRSTGGNPFFVTEVLAAPDAELPATVRDAVLARARDLDPAVRAALEAICVVPAAVDRELAADLLGDGTAALGEAERRGILLADAADVWFRHELARRTMEHELPSHERIRHHRRALASLEARGADVSRLMHHAVAAADADAIVRHGPAAARAAARVGGNREALAHHAEVLRVADRLPPRELAQVESEYAFALYAAQRFDEAVEHGERALALLDPAVDAPLVGATLANLAYVRYWLGDPAAGRAAARRAIELLEPLGASPGLAIAYGALAGIMMMADDPGTAEQASRALAIAETLGRRDLIANALNYLGCALMAARDPRGQELLERGLALARAMESPLYVVRICANFVRMLLRASRLAEAEPYLRTGLAVANEHQLDFGLYRIAALGYGRDLALGRWAEAEAGLRALIARFPDAGVDASHAHTFLGRVLARRGAGEAPEVLERAWAVAERSGEIQRLGAAAVAWVELGWLNGDVEPALPRARRVLELAARTPHAEIHAELTVYLRRAGQAPPPPEDAPEPWALALRGRHAEAADAWERIGNRYERALELAASGDERRAATALDLLEGLGAGPAVISATGWRPRGDGASPRAGGRETGAARP